MTTINILLCERDGKLEFFMKGSGDDPDGIEKKAYEKISECLKSFRPDKDYISRILVKDKP